MKGKATLKHYTHFLWMEELCAVRELPAKNSIVFAAFKSTTNFIFNSNPVNSIQHSQFVNCMSGTETAYCYCEYANYKQQN